jgi:catechol 2,3-dioxygenase-like lactoylglutathione lyase family enzyme
MPFVPATSQLVVEVYVRNLARSRDFYQRLGFTLLREDVDFAELVWEEHRFFLASGAGVSPEPGTPTANVRIMVPDVDRFWQLCADLGARVIAPIDDRYYGLRDFTIADPDGFGIRFATPLPGKAP